MERPHLLAGDFAAEVDVAARSTDAEIHLPAQLAIAVPRDLAVGSSSEKECRHAPRRAIAQIRRLHGGQCGSGGDRVLRARNLLADEVKGSSRDSAELVGRLIGECPADELPREVANAQVRGERIGRALEMRAQEVPTHALRRRPLRVVLVRGIVQQPLVRRPQGKQAYRVRAAERHAELGRGVVALAAIMGQERRIVVARIARIGRRRGVHRVRIEPTLRVDDRDETGTTGQRSTCRDDSAVESEIGAPTERTISLVGRASAPVLVAILRYHVDQTRNRLPVARRKPVRRERSFREDIGRDSHAQRTGGSIELILDAETVEDECQLSQPAPPVALPDRTGR